jgi:hypothetical protein
MPRYPCNVLRLAGRNKLIGHHGKCYQN